MRLKYKFKNLWRIIRYAFFSKTALIICIVSAVVIDAVLAVIMLNLDNSSRRYDLVFALLTGVTASFVVSFVIECAGNYRRNKKNRVPVTINRKSLIVVFLGVFCGLGVGL